ncbi:MAG TPA: YqiA/YcfP family alpha/beta fold hydrolase [Flavobacteriaceae bacterium]|nr:YqiA/YcfP family alpha/beta fold hydrolase [Flavobacteriaceae bacterium]
MKPLFYFIHGFGSGKDSGKYRKLQNHFKDYFEFDLMEWNPDSDFPKLLNIAEKKLSQHQNPIILGDSTGANFAYQLRERLNEKDKASKLILSSPLFDIDRRLRAIEFSKNLQSALIRIKNPEKALIIADPEDEVVDQSAIFSKELQAVKLIQTSDGHRLPEFENYLETIEAYIKED